MLHGGHYSKGKRPVTKKQILFDPTLVPGRNRTTGADGGAKGWEEVGWGGGRMGRR